MKKPTVGQIVFEKAVGNAAPFRGESKLVEYTVKKVGRKYFTAGMVEYPHTDTQYYISDWEQKSEDYSITSKLFETEQAYLDEVEAIALYKECRNFFNLHHWDYNKIPLELLRKFKILLSEAENE